MSSVDPGFLALWASAIGNKQHRDGLLFHRQPRRVMTTQLSNNDQTFPTLENTEDADLLSNDQESIAKSSESQRSMAQGSMTQGSMTRAEAGDTTAGVAGPASHSKDGLTEALKSERRRSNQLEKDLRGLKQQLNRFSEINPEEYSRLQEAERQKQLLEQQIELRERQMEEASSKKVLAAITERDGAQALVLALRKERLLERAFSEAEGRTGGDSRGTFFDVFKGQLDSSFRLCVSKDVNTPDSLEPLDSSGQPLLGEDGRPMSVNDFLDQLRIHPVYGFLFQQRGAISSFGPGVGPALAANPFGEVINPQSMTAAELYRASFASPTAKKRAL